MKTNPSMTRAAFLLQLLTGVLGMFFIGSSFAEPPAVPEGEALRKLVVGVWKFKIDDIVEAHRVMETNQAGGKIVVTT